MGETVATTVAHCVSSAAVARPEFPARTRRPVVGRARRWLFHCADGDLGRVMSPGEMLDQETDVGDPPLNRRDVAVLLPGSPPRSRYLGLLVIGGLPLVERERLGMSMRQRAPEAERGGDALKRADAPVHLIVEQLDVEHLRFLTRIEPLQLGPGWNHARSEIVEERFSGKGDEHPRAD
jgi:hypothetical protein